MDKLNSSNALVRMGYSAEEIEVRVQSEQGERVRSAWLDQNVRRSRGLSPAGHYGPY